MLTARQKDKILSLQVEMMDRYFDEYTKFYNGDITDAEYQVSRVQNVSLWYAKQMVRAGLADREFDTAWMRKFAEDTLVLEREVAPVGEELTIERMNDLCKVAVKWGKKFFENFHTDFSPKVTDKRMLHEKMSEPTDEELKAELDEAIRKGEWQTP